MDCRGAPLDITALKPGEVYELHRYLKSKVCCFIFFAKLIFCVILLIGFLSSVHFKRGVWQKLLQSFDFIQSFDFMLLLQSCDFMLLSNPLIQIKTKLFLKIRKPLQRTLQLIWGCKCRSDQAPLRHLLHWKNLPTMKLLLMSKRSGRFSQIFRDPYGLFRISELYQGIMESKTCGIIGWAQTLWRLNDRVLPQENIAYTMTL